MNDQHDGSEDRTGEALAGRLPLSRRDLFGIAGGAAAVIVLAACGGDNSGSSAPTTGASNAATTSGTPTAASANSTPGSGSASQQTQPGKPGGRLRVVHGANPTTLDPHAGSSGNDYIMLYPVFDTLISFTPDLQPIPGLAASWQFDNPQTF